MENIKTYVKISLKEGLLEVGGSEEFVSENIDKLTEYLKHNTQDNVTLDEGAEAENVNDPGPVEAPSAEPGNSNRYSKSLHFEGDDIRILKKMPGTNNAQKSVNTALVYLWAKKQVGIDDVPYTEIRELCKNQGCLDSANFSAHMKSARQEIIVSGKQYSAAKTCKLTLPGVGKSIELLDSLE